MNKYFTKEYIKECDCEEIKGLRKDCWIYGDYISFNRNKPRLVITEVESILEEEIFIPRSDQLDEEIIKICKIGYNYNSSYCQATKTYVSYIEPDYPDKELTEEITVYGDNFLIAKIKLLKELLK